MHVTCNSLPISQSGHPCSGMSPAQRKMLNFRRHVSVSADGCIGTLDRLSSDQQLRGIEATIRST